MVDALQRELDPRRPVDAVVERGVAEQQDRREREHHARPPRLRPVRERDEHQAGDRGDRCGDRMDPAAPGRLALEVRGVVRLVDEREVGRLERRRGADDTGVGSVASGMVGG